MSSPLVVPATHARRALLRSTTAITLAALTACAPVSRRGLKPIVTDRPDFTESAETVPEGMRQLEAGSTFNRTVDEQNTSVGEGLLRVGLSRNTELRVAFNSFAVSRAGGKTVTGFEDFSLGTKLKLVQGGGEGSFKPTVALIVGTSIPTGGPQIGSSKPQPEMKFLTAWDLNSRVSFSSNINYGRETDDLGDYTVWAATGSLGMGLTEHLGSYVEYYSFHPTQSPLASTHFVDGGFTYGLTDNVQLDIRSGVAIRTVSGRDVFLGLGIARRW